jgi:hypothetical protein
VPYIIKVSQQWYKIRKFSEYRKEQDKLPGFFISCLQHTLYFRSGNAKRVPAALEARVRIRRYALFTAHLQGLSHWAITGPHT